VTTTSFGAAAITIAPAAISATPPMPTPVPMSARRIWRPTRSAQGYRLDAEPNDDEERRRVRSKRLLLGAPGCGTLQAMPVSAELRRELLSLPPEEREALADELYDSLDEEEARDPEWGRAWSKEIAGRLRDLEEGRVELIDTKEMFQELRAEFGNKRR
jgi:putative addiction module component (TIGR02574 family)